MSRVKLIIWDLDDTLWDGTLEEGDIELNEHMSALVKKSTDRGIVNSIVSKNYFNRAKEALIEFGLWDYFVFPQISMNSKGEIVSNLLKEIGLRAPDTVFVDDNTFNRKEVEFYNPRITCCSREELEKILICSEDWNKQIDKSHKRLNQYRILEKKSEDMHLAASNEAFLKESNIRIFIDNVNESNKERIYELLQRTNQLNYTKVRLSRSEFDELLISDSENKCISVKDKYGNYGIVGFYSLLKGDLIHFLFSCRILGMGVEHYIYNKLGHPLITVVGETASSLEKEIQVDWINEDDNSFIEQSVTDAKGKVLMIGGCDLESAKIYIDSAYIIETEFARIIDGKLYRTSDSWQLADSIRINDEIKKINTEYLPFCSPDVTYATHMFSGVYDAVIWSVVDDYIRCMFKKKDNSCMVGVGGFFDYEEILSQRYSEDELSFFYNNYICDGKISEQLFEDNIRFILSNISTNVNVLLINGNEVDVSDWIGVERVERNCQMNRVVDRIIKDYPNVYLMDMRKIAVDESAFSDIKDNRHYSRKVYYDLGKGISEWLSANV